MPQYTHTHIFSDAYTLTTKSLYAIFGLLLPLQTSDATTNYYCDSHNSLARFPCCTLARVQKNRTDSKNWIGLKIGTLYETPIFCWRALVDFP